MTPNHTAVDMMAARLSGAIDWTDPYYADVLNNAREMERQQIIEAWKKGDGEHDNTATKLSKEYYNKTYGN